MHKHPRTSRRKIIALRFFVYGLMTLATLIISAICVLLVMGYQFNFSKRTIEQGGLVQFRSFPEAATIGLDGTTLSELTPAKANVASGIHSVTMSRAGYRPWSKTVSVDPGQLLWLNYTRLVPQNITTTSIREFETLSGMLASPDREQLVLLPSAGKPELVRADIRDEKRVEFNSIVLPAAAYEHLGALSRISLQEWDFGSRYMIVQVTGKKGTDYLRVDTENVGRTVSIDELLGIDIDEVHFSGTSGNIYYAVSEGRMRRVDISAKTISAPIANDVVEMAMYGENTIAYVSRDEGISSVGIYRNGTTREVATYNDPSPVALAVTEYFGRIYLAVTHGKTAYIYTNPHQTERKDPRTVELPFGAVWADYSSNGRFLVVGTKDRFLTYDAEIKVSYPGTLKGARTTNEAFAWLDDYHFVTSGSAALIMTEFDGANPQFITDTVPGFESTLSANGKMLYSVGRQPDGPFTLQASRMVVEN